MKNRNIIYIPESSTPEFLKHLAHVGDGRKYFTVTDMQNMWALGKEKGWYEGVAHQKQQAKINQEQSK